ncbi:MAG: DUF3078 domain-containing protein [Muribaculaceae bacterium]|nr:DUF3078 domain-containing protein [Muribaculaceae bacterium]
MKQTLRTFFAVAALAVGLNASAQAQYFGSAKVGSEEEETVVAEQTAETIQTVSPVADKAKPDSTVAVVADTAVVAEQIPDSIRYRVRSVEELSFYLDTLDMRSYDNLMGSRPLPKTFFLPSVFTGYEFPDTTSAFRPELSGNPDLEWIEEEIALQRKIKAMNYYLYSTHPERVIYNINLLPEAPKEFHAVVDPEKHTIKIEEIATKEQAVTPINLAPGRKRHWMRQFSASFHFAQGYVSPNWYGGGENNVNGSLNLRYYVKLNEKYHKNLLFETTMTYGLGAQSTKNDTIRGYNVTSDQFQLNSVFGVHAIKRWYYSVKTNFRTRLFNYYQTNTRNLQQSILAPGYLNVGVGMTWSYSNKKGNFNFNLSLNPLSYDLTMCLDDKLNPQNFGIKEGHKTFSKYGSDLSGSMSWRIAYNITYNSNFNGFTNYESAYFNWNNTIDFAVNRYLSTSLRVNFRYDTDTRRCDNPSWKKLQMYEQLSFGLTYNFSTI